MSRVLVPRLVIVGFAFLALLVVLSVSAQESEATITGVQPPTTGNWVIDKDTTVLGETFTLEGNVIVRPGYDLIVRNTVITMKCSHAGQYGFLVESGSPSDGYLKVTQSSIVAQTSTKGWTFQVRGDALLDDTVVLRGVRNGLQIYDDDVTVRKTEVHASGVYGLAIFNCDPTIEGVVVRNVNDVEGEWSNMESRPDTVIGVLVQGNTTIIASPTIRNLTVHVKLVDTWAHDLTTYRAYEYIFVNGLVASYADLGTLTDVDITFDVRVDATLKYSTSTVYLYNYMEVHGIQLSDRVDLDGFKNVLVSNSTYHTEVDQTGASKGYLYDYFRFYGLYTNVTSSGGLPATLSGLTLQGHDMTYDLGTSFELYDYISGRAIYWFPAAGLTPTSTLSIGDVTFDGIKVELLLSYSSDLNLSVKGATIINNIFGSDRRAGSIINLNSWRREVDFDNNVIVNNTQSAGNLFSLNYFYEDFLFLNNNVSGNSVYSFFYGAQIQRGHSLAFEYNQWNGNTFNGYGMYTNYCYGDHTFKGNEIRGNSALGPFLYSRYSYGAFQVDGNEWHQNQFSDWTMYLYYQQSDGQLILNGNSFTNNTMAGGVYNYRFRGDATVTNNEVRGNSFGVNGFSNLYYPYYNNIRVLVTGNSFEANSFSGSALVFSSFGSYYSASLDVEKNSFINNSAGTGTMGLILVENSYQNIELNDNTFRENRGTSICGNGLYSSSYTFAVLRNTFINNTGRCIAMDNVYDAVLSINTNTAIGNKGYCVYLEQSSTRSNGPNSVTVASNVFSGNPGGGIYLRVGNWESRYSYYGNPNQAVSVKWNDLRDTGEDGWALAVLGFYAEPTLLTNDWSGSAMGQYLEFTLDEARRPDLTLTLSSLNVDSVNGGNIAFGFCNIDAELDGCSMLNYKNALYAKDCEVNAWHCRVPEASGVTEGDGAIYVWNELEILVTWANATGHDSGFGVPDATVALRGANGEYFGAKTTGQGGWLKSMIVPTWASVAGEMDAYSPFDATVMAEGISTSVTLHLVGDRKSPWPARLLLVDYSVPELVISSPVPGSMTPDTELLVEGFLFEIGSGIARFEGRSDEMAEGYWVEIEPDRVWQMAFIGLDEGRHNLTIRAGDLAGNWNVTKIPIVVDTKAPVLDIRMDYITAVPIPYNETRKGYFVRDETIAINGTFTDDWADKRDIVVRINGEQLPVYAGSEGRILKRVGLENGFNVIIVDATDLAGNRVVIELTITQDSTPPILYIYTPKEGETTANATQTITGLTEPGTRLDIIVQASAGTRSYVTLARSDGAFEFDVDLFEGIQKVLVTASDSAGNPTTKFRDVILDTTPPEFSVTQPESDRIFTRLTRYTIRCTMAAEPGTAFIYGQEVPNPGIFSREIVLQEGENVIDIRVIDRVGNERVKFVSIIRDTIPPLLTVTTPLGDSLLTRISTIRFEGTVDRAHPEGGVVIEHRSYEHPAVLFEGTWDEGGSWEYDLELAPEDLDQDITITAFDQAGNVAVRTVRVVYDSIPPSLYIDPVPEKTRSSILRVNGTTDIDITQVLLGDYPFPVTDGEFSLAWALPEGDSTFAVTVIDRAGNVASTTFDINYKPLDKGGDGDADAGDSAWASLGAWALILAAITIAATAVSITNSARREE